MPTDLDNPNPAANNESGGMRCVPGCRTRPLLRAQQNLLMPLLYQARKALGELDRSDPARSPLQRVVVAAVRAEELARRGAHATGATFTVCDLASIAREALQLFAGALPADLPLLLIARCKAPPVLGDELLLHQLLVELIAAAGTAASWGDEQVVHVEVDAGRGGWDEQRNQTRLSVRIASPAGAASLSLDRAQLGLVRDLVALHCGQVVEQAGGVHVSLPAASAEPHLLPVARRVVVGFDDGSATVAHIDGCLRGLGRDVVTASHAHAAAGFAALHRPWLGAFFATTDEPHSVGAAWLLEMAHLHPTVPRLLVVPDELVASPVFDAHRGALTIVARHDVPAALARCQGQPANESRRG